MAERQQVNPGQTVMTAPIRPVEVVAPRRESQSLAGGMSDLASGLGSLGKDLERIRAVHQENETKDAQLAIERLAIQTRINATAENENLDQMTHEDMDTVVTKQKGDFNAGLADIAKLYPTAKIPANYTDLKFDTTVGVPLMEQGYKNTARIKLENRVNIIAQDFALRLSTMPVPTDDTKADNLFATVKTQNDALKAQPDTYLDPRTKQRLIDANNKALYDSITARAISMDPYKDQEEHVYALTNRAVKEAGMEPKQKAQIDEIAATKMRAKKSKIPSAAITARINKNRSTLEGGFMDDAPRMVAQKQLLDDLMQEGTSPEGETTQEYANQSLRIVTYSTALGDLRTANHDTVSRSYIPVTSELIPNAKDHNMIENYQSLVQLFPAKDPELSKQNATKLITEMYSRDKGLRDVMLDASPDELQKEFITPLLKAAQEEVTLVQSGRSNILAERSGFIPELTKDPLRPKFINSPEEAASIQKSFADYYDVKGVPENLRQYLPSYVAAPLEGLIDQNDKTGLQAWLVDNTRLWGAAIPMQLASLSQATKSQGNTTSPLYDQKILSALYYGSMGSTTTKIRSEQVAAVNRGSDLVFSMVEANQNRKANKEMYEAPTGTESKTLLDKLLGYHSGEIARYNQAAFNDPMARDLLQGNTSTLVQDLAYNFHYSQGMPEEKAVDSALKLLNNAAYPVLTGTQESGFYQFMSLNDSGHENAIQQFVGAHTSNHFVSVQQRAAEINAALGAIKYHSPGLKPMDVNPFFAAEFGLAGELEAYGKDPYMFGHESDIITRQTYGPRHLLRSGVRAVGQMLSASPVFSLPAATVATGMIDGAPYFDPSYALPLIGSMNVNFADLHYRANGKLIPLADLYDPTTSTFSPEQVGFAISERLKGRGKNAPRDIYVLSAIGPSIVYQKSSLEDGFVMLVRANAVGSDLIGKVDRANGYIQVMDKNNRPIVIKFDDVDRAIDLYHQTPGMTRPRIGGNSY